MVGGEIVPCLEHIGKKFDINRLMIMIQDVAHARAGGAILSKVMAQKGWTVLGDPMVYPTGTTDFSMGLQEAKKQNAQVIIIWMDMPESAILLKQWYDMKVPALPFGTIIAAAEQPGFWKATDGKGEYLSGERRECRQRSQQRYSIDDEICRCLQEEVRARARRLRHVFKLSGCLYAEGCDRASGNSRFG